jgi:hypothetical protein
MQRTGSGKGKRRRRTEHRLIEPALEDGHRHGTWFGLLIGCKLRPKEPGSQPRSSSVKHEQFTGTQTNGQNNCVQHHIQRRRSGTCACTCDRRRSRCRLHV